MKLWFRDGKRKLRCVECEWEFSALNDQNSLMAAVKTGTGITPCGLILGVVE